ncbi:hypothetical protein [Pseudomonas sp. KNUC1026]|uniref:hypothetical protein n=1 Tax=Pseudomonas sp. KNUC1026 TaxID=2893890 RepID=UPI003FA6D156
MLGVAGCARAALFLPGPRRARRSLADHPKAFTSPLVALTYSDQPGAQAQLDLALFSEEAGLQTALTRLVDAGENVRQRAAESSKLFRQPGPRRWSASAAKPISHRHRRRRNGRHHSGSRTERAGHRLRRHRRRPPGPRNGSGLASESLGAMQQMAESVSDIGQAVDALAEQTPERRQRGRRDHRHG